MTTCAGAETWIFPKAHSTKWTPHIRNAQLPEMRSIVPGCESKVKISIKELAARFFTHYPAAEEKTTLGSIISSVTVTTPPFEERLARLLGETFHLPPF